MPARWCGRCARCRKARRRSAPGDLDRHIEVRTGDELEGLAEQFNRMSAQLRESYAGLERKVEQRTAELTNALEHQTATSEVLRVISSSTADSVPVFEKILESCDRLFASNEQGILLLGDDGRGAPGGAPRPRSASAWRACSRSAQTGNVQTVLLERGDPPLSRTCSPIPTCRPASAPSPSSSASAATRRCSLPMVWKGQAIGSLYVTRQPPTGFSDKRGRAAATFADQAVIAIENVAPVQRDQGGARAPDRDRRGAARHQRLADRRAAGVRRRSRSAPCGCAARTSASSSASTATLIHIAATPRREPRERSGCRCAGVPDAAEPTARPRRAPSLTGSVGQHRATFSRTPTYSHKSLARPGRPATAASWRCRCCASGEAVGAITVARAEPRRVRRAQVDLLRDLRRPGGDRDRERSPVQRDQGSARAADRDGRDPEGDRQLARRRAAGLRRDRGQLQPADGRPLHRCLPDHRRRLASQGVHAGSARRRTRC